MINPISSASININNNFNKTDNENIINTNVDVKNEVENKTSAGITKKNINEVNECKTCAERSYQDVSNDGGVSYQTPTKLSPALAASAVYRHEREHFNREQVKAKREDKDVVKNEIRLHSAICPECGRMYISGGETITATVHKDEASQKALNKNEIKGINFDMHA